MKSRSEKQKAFLERRKQRENEISETCPEFLKCGCGSDERTMKRQYASREYICSRCGFRTTL